MKADRRSVVLVPSAVQAVDTTRGHRSLGDENLTLAKGKAQGSIQDRTNINARGWNNSTRASPVWRRTAKENKENGKPLVPKKFQHVQSKLSAPVFSQRRAKLTEGVDKGAPGGPLQPSPDVLNAPAQTSADNLRASSTEDHQGGGPLPAFDSFVTKRVRDHPQDDLPSDGHVLTASGPSWPASPERHQAARGVETEAETEGPDQRQSPHPSVSALYEYAQKVRTPVSGVAKPVSGGALVEHIQGPHRHDEASAPTPELQDGELTDSFTSWLRCMGMQPHTLPAVVLDRMGALWHKAKEAMELQALVAQLKEDEAKLASSDVQENALAVDLMVPQSRDSENAEVPEQQQLIQAEDRLAHLRVSQSPPDDAEAGHGTEVASTNDVVELSTESEAGQQASSGVSTRLAAVGQIDSPGGSTASVALWALTPDKGSDHSSHSPAGTQLTAASAAITHDEAKRGPAAGAAESFSISLGSQMQPDFSSAFGQGRAGVLQSTSSCASFNGVPFGGPTTPGFSVVSRIPEPVPFAAWANQVHGNDAAVSPGAPAAFGSPESAGMGTPEGAMPSPSAVPRTSEAAFSLPDAVSPQQSAGISFASRTVQPVAFATWATCAGMPEPTPSSLRPTRDGPANLGSPQLSAGLSVISGTPQAVAFDVWASVQRRREAQSAAAQAQSTPGDCGRESPLSSVGFETSSKPERPGMWSTSEANTPADGAPAAVAHASPAGPHVRQNPLFEIDSPASTMSALPERADALGGLAASPSPARMLSAPSLASTPMSDFSQGLRSNLTSPTGDEFNGSPSSQFYGGLTPPLHAAFVFRGDDLPSPAAPSSNNGPVAVGVTVFSTEPTSPVGTSTSQADPVHDHSPLHGEASFVAAAPDDSGGEVPCGPQQLPSFEELPTCAAPVQDNGLTIATGTDPHETDVCSMEDSFSPAAQTKDLGSPATDSLTETDFAASPVMDVALATECTDISTVEQGDVAAVDTVREGRQSALPEGSPAASGTIYTPSPPQNKAGDFDPGPGGDGPTQSYPDTPATAWPASPTTVYATPLEAFPTPTSLASFCSAVQLTAMRIQAELASPGAAASDFTFGIQAGACGGRQDAVTPALGLADDNRFTASPVATLGFHYLPSVNAAPAGFGSPLPLTQLTPVQLRALDHLAGHVMAALTPTRHEPASAQPYTAQKDSSTSSDVQQGTAAAAVAFDLAQLLAHLHSPLPSHIGHQKSRFAPGATEPADTVPAASIPDPQSCQPYGASAPAPSAAQAQHGDACVMEPGIKEMSLMGAPSLPNFARLLAFLNAGGRAPAASPLTTTVSGAHSKAGDAAMAHGSVPQGVGLAHLLSNLHSPLPEIVRVDSPVMGDKNSPASSEAASSAFGFSTAAKMSTRPTPTFTPGGGMSFMRWAHDAAPPSFRLESDARQPRSRAAGTPSTPMSFSFGAFHGTAVAPEEATPIFGQGDSHGAQVRSLPGKIFRSPDDLQSGSGTQTVEDCAVIHASGTGSPAAFSFGQQQGRLSGHLAAPIGVESAHGRVVPVVTEAGASLSVAKLRNQASPGLSLGVWGFQPAGGAASVRGSVTPSSRAFTFNNGGGSLMPTPMWPGLGGAASPVPEQEKDMGAVLGQLSTSASPQPCGMPTQNSAKETPAGKLSSNGAFHTVTDVYAPAAAALWTVLLGNLHSPMPAAVRMPREYQPKEISSVSAAFSLPSGLGPHPADVSRPPMSTPTPGLEPVNDAQTDAAVGLGACDFPPSYEDLPDLITRGLCLPAPSPSPGSQSLPESAPGDLTNARMPVGTTQLPCVDCPKASAGPLSAEEAQAVPDEHRMSRPTQIVQQPLALLNTDGSPITAQPSSSEQLIVESVSSSYSGSESTLYATGEAAGRTTEPAHVELREELLVDSAKPANAEEVSVHNSPVFSFHVASEGSAESVSSSEVVTSTVACAAGPSADAFAIGSSAVVSHQHESFGGTQVGSPAKTDSVAFSLDAVPRLLFSVTTEDGATEPQANGGATEIAENAGSMVADLVTTDEGPNDAEVMPTPGTSPAPSKRRDAPDAAVSPVTFSYLSSGTPPSTPPTAELASTAKGGPSWPSRVSPRGSTGGAHFWAPSPAGPSAASGERVMLESSNRRIRTNPDILLDFQGSPGHIPPPIAPSCGQSTHRAGASHAAPQISPARKGWEPILGGRDHQLSILPISNTHPSAGAHESAKPKSDDSTVPAPAAGYIATGISRHPVEMPLVSARLRALQQGVGPTLQQQVAMGIEHTIASHIHVPISQRLGLWPQPAWGIPCGAPASGAPGGALTASATGVQPLPPCNRPSSTVPEVTRPVLTSRDVQTTPGLLKTVIDDQDGGPSQHDSVPRDGRVPERSTVVSRRPPFKSRIPAPGGITASATVLAAVPASAQTSGAVSAVNSDDDEGHNGKTSAVSTFGVVRRRQMCIPAAAVGGPQRMVIKRSAGQPRSVVQEAGDVVVLGDAEMRRRAAVMGMRISPYLRTKQGKKTATEAPKKG